MHYRGQSLYTVNMYCAKIASPLIPRAPFPTWVTYNFLRNIWIVPRDAGTDFHQARSWYFYRNNFLLQFTA